MAQRVKRPVEAWWYVLKADRDLPDEQQSRFLLRPLTSAERMRVWDDYNVTTRTATGDVTVRDRAFQQARELVLSHVERIENFPAGAAVAWPESHEARERYLEMLDDLAVWEIGNEIREHSSFEREAAPSEKRGTPEEEAAVAKNS